MVLAGISVHLPFLFHSRHPTPATDGALTSRKGPDKYRPFAGLIYLILDWFIRHLRNSAPAFFFCFYFFERGWVGPFTFASLGGHCHLKLQPPLGVAAHMSPPQKTIQVFAGARHPM